MLYAKQGRVQQFTTKAARDKFLNDEIKSLKAYERAQQKRVEDLKKDVEGATAQLEEVVARAGEEAKGEEDRRAGLKKMSEDVSRLKGSLDQMQEQRK